MELDLNTLLKQYHTLRAQYSSLEESELNLFNHLSNIVNMDWNDGNSQLFAKVVDAERNETDIFRICIWNHISVFEYIYNRYSVLGKKIRCDLEKKDKVLSAVDQCISSVSSLNGTFSSMNLSFGYSEFHTLRSKKQMFNKMQNDLTNVRNHLAALYKKIEGIESDIGSKTRELDIFKPNPIIYSLTGNHEKYLKGNLVDQDFIMDVSKYEASIDDENSKLTKIRETMEQTLGCYKSNNIPLLEGKNSDYGENIKQVLEKRKTCLETLDKVPPLYGMAIKRTKDVFEEAEFNDKI